MQGAQGGGDQGQGQGRGGRRDGGAAGQGGQGRGGANVSDADRQKMRDLMQKIQAASGEEKDKLQKQLDEMRTKLGLGGRGEGRGQGGGEGRGAAGAGGGEGRGPGGGGRGSRGTFNPLDMLQRANFSPFTEDERNNAKLPLPPEQDSQVQTLLRPGLLADVEIVVEKLPDALHVPAQAVFQKNGKYVVFVQGKDGKYAPREVQLLKQSESTMVLSGGVQAGEIIALGDPTATGDKKGKGDKKSGSGAMSALPGGSK
jgi:hypothetical protein